MRPREPLARLVHEAMDNAGLTNAEVARLTKLTDQHVSQIRNRREPYKPHRLPEPETFDALAKIPGLSKGDVIAAARRSAGLDVGPAPEGSGLRRNVHNLIDEFSDAHLAGVLQVLLSLRDFVRNGNRR